jgi:hypothetical protein
VVTGFEPLDLLEGILMTVRPLEDGRFVVENQYARAVRRTNNTPAQDAVRQVFLSPTGPGAASASSHPVGWSWPPNPLRASAVVQCPQCAAAVATTGA